MNQQIEYAGFWVRLWAMLVDVLLITVVTLPILLAVYGRAYLDSGFAPIGVVDFLVTWVFPIVAVVMFWIVKSATPGKLLMRVRIVDATTGAHPTSWQFVGRYFAYFVSTLPLLLGFVWVAFDPRKQAWHDKLSGTVVIRQKRMGSEPVTFPEQEQVGV